jgi:hypothetical protein
MTKNLSMIKKVFLKKINENNSLSDPTMSPYSPEFFYYLCDRDPTNNEPDCYGGYDGLIYFWWNTTTLDLFICTNNMDNTNLSWEKWTTSNNILTILAQTWGLNTSRGYVQRSSPAFSTSYTPSTTNDTQVIATVSLTSTLLATAQVNVQVNTGSGFVTIAENSLSGVAATTIRSVTFTVPANASYQLVSVSGTASITQVMELTQ